MCCKTYFCNTKINIFVSFRENYADKSLKYALSHYVLYTFFKNCVKRADSHF